MSGVSGVPGDGRYPTFAELVAVEQEVLGRRIAASRPGGAAVPGPHPQRRAGAGLEPMEARPYVPGDEARHVDWRATARSGSLYSKRFEAEHARVCLVVADPDRRQFFGTRVRFKSLQAARAGAAAAWWALRQGDRVGCLNVADGALAAPRAGKAGVSSVLHALVKAYAAPPSREPKELATVLPAVARLARGGRVVVLAEPDRLAAVPLSVWAMLGRRQTVHLVCTEDPLETDPPLLRLDVETPAGRQQLDLTDPAVRSAWGASRRQALDVLRGAVLPGVQVHCLPTPAAASSWMPRQAGRP